MSTELVKYNEACRALAAASRVDEAKNIRDRAEAVRAYAKQAKNLDLERQAIEIRLRAERRTGELLIETKANGQRHNGRGNNKKLESPAVTPNQKLESPVVTPTLDDLGITKRQASDWQKMAEIPVQEFETKVKTVAETRGKTTTAAVLRDTKNPDPKPDEIQAQETAQRLQDDCRKVGLNVDVSPSREIGKFHITYRNLSEDEIRQAIKSSKATKGR